MRLTRLEIFGFKSFVERFSLHFDQNLIGIVGPNGCGKSNVVDALRWVLGETHAKQLRGGKQEDLIFNGSEARRALGLAEVSITIRPDEHWASRAEEQQDELSRLLAEDVEVANSSVSDEDSDTDTDTDTDEATNEPQLSESSQQQAEKSSLTPNVPESNVHSFLSELPELLHASEIQFTRRLYRSGESEYLINRVPCRLRDMIDIYRYIGLGSRGLNIVQQGQIGELISKKPIERREVLEEAAGISGFRSKLEAAQRKLNRTNDNLSRIKDIEIEVEKQVRVLKRQASRARARNDLKAELRQIEIDWFSRRTAEIAAKQSSSRLELDSYQEQVRNTESAYSEADARFTESQSHLEVQDQKLFELRRQRDTWAVALRQERERLQGIEKEIVRCETEKQSIEGQKEHLSEREQKIFEELRNRNEDKVRVEAELNAFQNDQQIAEESLEQKRHEVAQEIAAIETEIAQKLLNTEESESVASIDELQEEIQSLELELSTCDGIRSSLREVQSQVKAAYQALQRIAVSRASLVAEQETLLKQSQVVGKHVAKATSTEQQGEVLSTLAKGLVIPEDYQRAVHAALGDKGSFVVSPSASQLGEQFLAQDESKRNVSLGVIDRNPKTPLDRIGDLSSQERSAAPSAKLLIDCIEVASELKDATVALIGDVIVVDSLAEGLKLRDAGLIRSLVVSKNGEAVTPWGWFTTSGAGADFSFGRRLAELESSISQCDAEHAAAEIKHSELKQSEQELEEKVEDVGALRRKIDQQRKEINVILQQDRKNREAMQQEIRREEKRLRDAAMERERAAQLSVQEAAAEVSRRVSQLAFIEERIFVLGSEVQELEGRREQLGQRREELQALAADHQASLQSPNGDLELASSKVEEFEQELLQIEESRQGVAATHAELAQEVSERRREMESAKSLINQATLDVERCALELRMIHEEVETAYGEEAVSEVDENAKRVASDSDAEVSLQDHQQQIDELRESSLKLRKRLEREGEVDPESIQRYEEESARLEMLREQAADLQQAVGLLERTIRRLKELSRERFLETYGDVSKRFSELVPRLFGGGAGHMELINPEDPLTSGVEISVRPPGKKLSSMELLSGGEKALVATAVLVAMFLHRPSPICVLDEVDAPLDEANLDRFISLVAEISSSTQFLIITHNKATMSAMGRLVGITMQERGVSTALSVTLDEAEEELDRWVANA